MLVEKLKKNNRALYFVFAYFLYMVFVFLHSYSKRTMNWLIIEAIVITFSMILLNIGTYVCLLYKNTREICQLEMVSGVGWCTLFILVLRSFYRIAFYQESLFLIYGICILGLFLTWFNAFLYRWNNKIKTFEKLKKLLFENKELVFYLFAITMIYISQYGSMPKWDSVVTQNITSNKLIDIFNLNGINITSILRSGYSSINVLSTAVVQDTLLGSSILNYFLLIISIGAVYGICRINFPSSGKLTSLLLMSIYGVSPFVLGMSSLNNWDYWLFLLFPIMYYFYLKRLYIFYFFFAIIMCYTKETGVIAYGGFCLGCVVLDLLKRKKIKEITTEKKYIIAFLVGLSTVIAYGLSNYFIRIVADYESTELIVKYADTVSNPVASGIVYASFPNGTLRFEWLSFIRFIKILFVLNFNWVLTIISFLGFIYVVIKRRDYLTVWIPIIGSEILFVLFSCLFVTYNHPRYADTHIGCLCLMTILSLGMIEKKSVKNGIALILSGLLLISNYRTIDPLSLKLFNVHNVGTVNIINTEVLEEFPSDSIVYNQQYRYLDKAIDLAINDIIAKDTGAVICFPKERRDSFYFDVYSEEDGDIDIAYFDQIRKVRSYPNENTARYKMALLSADSDIHSLLLGEIEGYYCYMSGYGEAIAEKLVNDGVVLDEKNYEYKGWIINCLHLKYE